MRVSPAEAPSPCPLPEGEGSSSGSSRTYIRAVSRLNANSARGSTRYAASNAASAPAQSRRCAATSPRIASTRTSPGLRAAPPGPAHPARPNPPRDKHAAPYSGPATPHPAGTVPPGGTARRFRVVQRRPQIPLQLEREPPILRPMLQQRPPARNRRLILPARRAPAAPARAAPPSNHLARIHPRQESAARARTAAIRSGAIRSRLRSGICIRGLPANLSRCRARKSQYSAL